MNAKGLVFLSCLIIFCFYFGNAAAKPTAQDVAAELGLKQSALRSEQLPGWKKLTKIVLWGDATQLKFYQSHFPQLKFFASTNVTEVKRELADADALIGYCIPALFDSKLDLSYIHSLAVGVEGCVNADSLSPHTTLLTNSQRLSAPEIAEHAIALMFSLVRRLDQYALNQREKNWDRNVAPDSDAIWEISGRTMLVVGLGGIGTETARRASSLGMKVIATRNSSQKGPDFVNYVGLPQEVLKLASQADIVVNTVPLTDKTHGIFNRPFFEAMKPSAYFINVARGKSVITKDLIEALNQQQLAGAGLDVTDPEPLPSDHPLWQQPRVIITPHVAYRSEKLRHRVQLIAVDNLRRYLAGDKLWSLVDRTKGY